jgi:hypothetical protein
MTTPQRRRRTSADSGETVLRNLLDVAPDGLTRAQLEERMAPDYSSSQVYLGTLWVKKVGAGREGRPYAWSRRKGHCFPDDVDEAVAHVLSQGRRAYTALDPVLKSTTDPLLQQRPPDPKVRALHDRFNNAVREVGIALEEAKHPPPSPSDQAPTPA